jgi:outer membrane protein assembly factor BamB
MKIQIMKLSFRHARLIATLLFSSALMWPAAAANWPSWRGHLDGSGIVDEPEAKIPATWSATENVRWKVELPGPGNSSPIVWNNRVFLTQAADEGKRRLVICFDRKGGKKLWESGPAYNDPEESHEANPQCSASPVTDGERVVAWFGSAGVYCFDLNGKELWHRDLGAHKHEWGYGASPIIYKDLCILNFGPGKHSFLIAFNKKNGKTVWQVDTPEEKPGERTDGFAGKSEGVVGSWSTPIVIQAGGHDELIMTYPEKVRAFDPRSGKELWFCDGLNPLVYPSPLYGDGLIVAMGSFYGNHLAVKPGGHGNVTATDRVWQQVRAKSGIGSGLIHDGYIYNMMGSFALCWELQTGKPVWEERLQGTGADSDSWSSPVLVGDRIYQLNHSGDTVIFRASPKFEKIAVNPLGGEKSNSSLAISNGDIFIRTHQHLWCISNGGKSS